MTMAQIPIEEMPSMNLAFPVEECHTTMAQSMIDQLCAGENISDVLAKDR